MEGCVCLVAYFLQRLRNSTVNLYVMRLLGIPQLIIFPSNPGSRQQHTGCRVDAGWLGGLAILTSASVTFGSEPQQNGSLYVRRTSGWKTDKPTLKVRMFIYGYQDSVIK